MAMNQNPDGLLQDVFMHGGSTNCPDYTVFVSRAIQGDAETVMRDMRGLVGQLHDAIDAIRVEQVLRANEGLDGATRLDPGA